MGELGGGIAYIGINLSQYYEFLNDKMWILHIFTITMQSWNSWSPNPKMQYLHIKPHQLSYILWSKFGYYKFDKKKINPYFPTQHVGIASLVQKIKTYLKNPYVGIA